MLHLGLLSNQLAFLLPRLELLVVRIFPRFDPAALPAGECPGIRQRHSLGAAEGQLLALASGAVDQAIAGIARRRVHQHEARHAARVPMLDAIGWGCRQLFDLFDGQRFQARNSHRTPRAAK
jgi:hypothetical protein